tara:strand:+ start:103 stop:456 length:354 start_codon:yes stop_codon:yes gene_type:complete
MQIPRAIGEIAGWGAAIWMAYHILKEPSVEDQCWDAARATRTIDPLGRDPEDAQLRLQEIEKNANTEDAPDNVVRGCVYDACYFTRPKWTPETISKVKVFIPRDRGCERRGRAEADS